MSKILDGMKIYKIQNKDGEYSCGGMYPHFSKHGKAWTSIGALKNHINQIHRNCKIYDNCQIVEYVVISSPSSFTPFEQFVKEWKGDRSK